MRRAVCRRDDVDARRGAPLELDGEARAVRREVEVDGRIGQRQRDDAQDGAARRHLDDGAPVDGPDGAVHRHRRRGERLWAVGDEAELAAVDVDREEVARAHEHQARGARRGRGGEGRDQRDQDGDDCPPTTHEPSIEDVPYADAHGGSSPLEAARRGGRRRPGGVRDVRRWSSGGPGHLQRTGRPRVRLRRAGAAPAEHGRAPRRPRGAPGRAEGRRAPALPLAGGMYLADAKRPLQFHAPDGYLFTVRGSAAALMRRAGARAVYPEIGVWHVDASRGPALRDRLLAQGLLHDAGLDTRRQLRAIPGSDPLAVTEWWKDNVDAEGIDLPPPRKRLLIIDAGLDVAHPEFAGRPATVLENKQDVRFAPKKSGRDHGTRVASMAAAPVNGQGISGVFPTVGLGMWDAGGDEGFPIAQELKAIRRGVSKRYSVVNMSFDSTLPNQRFVEAGVRAEALGIARGYGFGLLFVAAAGNEFDDPKTSTRTRRRGDAARVHGRCQHAGGHARDLLQRAAVQRRGGAGRGARAGAPGAVRRRGGWLRPDEPVVPDAGHELLVAAGGRRRRARLVGAPVAQRRPDRGRPALQRPGCRAARLRQRDGLRHPLGAHGARRAGAGGRPDGAERGHGARGRHGLRAARPVPARPAAAQGGAGHRRLRRRDRGSRGSVPDRGAGELAPRRSRCVPSTTTSTSRSGTRTSAAPGSTTARTSSRWAAAASAG